MSKKEQFLMLVQTAVIIESLKGNPPEMNTESGRATMTLSAAMRIPEHLLIDDLGAACDMLIEAIFYRKTPTPDWLVTATAGRW